MKRIFIIISSSILVFILAIILIISKKDSPEIVMNEARKLLAEAETLKASEYSANAFLKAKNYYDSALIAWRAENEKFILFRNYKRSAAYAEYSISISNEAIKISRRNKESSRQQCELRISHLKNQIEEFEKRYGNFPFQSSSRNEFVRSKLLFDEAVMAFKSLKYKECLAKIDKTEVLIQRLQELYAFQLSSYFEDFDLWEKWIEQTLTFSRKYKTYCIVVDKFKRECSIYNTGKLLFTLNVELGFNWIGDKNQQGDKATPEGIYRIIRKKTNKETRYYKALLLDYPNDDDKKRFQQNINDGSLPKSSTIGNLIEIHGEGGKGLDWTDGCIALTNTDMDRIFSLCQQGTRVAIVGSTIPLDKLFSME